MTLDSGMDSIQLHRILTLLRPLLRAAARVAAAAQVW